MMRPDCVNTAYRWGAVFLKKAGFDTPLLDAQVLLGKAFGKERLDLFALNRSFVSRKVWEAYKSFIRRRLKGEPVAYIIRKKEFMSLEFEVNDFVFIPRPETEILVEKAIEVMNGLGKKMKVLEIGTGSGVIAVSLAKFLKNLHVVALDKSREALRVAKRNAKKHGVLDRIKLVNEDIRKYANGGNKFDIIISNPPYVALKDWEGLDDSIKKYEPRDALIGGKDGLDYYKIISQKAPFLMKEGGFLILEIYPRQAEIVEKILRSVGFGNMEIFKDLSGLERVVVARLGISR